MYGITYCAQNFENQKCYIGQTTKSLEERKQCHLSHAGKKKRNYPFYNALRKYDVDNFKWCILSEEDSKKELDIAEQKWIAQLETTR